MIAIIAALTSERVIGKDGQLPWHLPEDLKQFKKLTSGNTVIMGRKTWDSIPAKFRPLPNRYNIVISRTMPETEGAIVCRSVEEARHKAEMLGQATFVIGGSSIYDAFLPLADTLYLSWVTEAVKGDTYFPELDLSAWQDVDSTAFEGFRLVHYRRKTQ